MEQYRGKKVLIVGLGRSGFALIHFFNTLDCDIRVTDIKPIFDLNKAVKRLKKVKPTPQLTLGEHKDEDFLEADVIVFSSAVDQNISPLMLAREHGKEVYSETTFAAKFIDKPIIAVCGTHGRTTVSHMIGFCLKLEKKKVFVGGTSEEPLINFHSLPDKEEIEYVILELSPVQLKSIDFIKPKIVVYPHVDESKIPKQFRSLNEYLDVCFKPLELIDSEGIIVANFDKLASHSVFRESPNKTYWYSRRSFATLGVINEVQGTHFHEKRIHSNINCHSEFRVNKMRIVGSFNRENLLCAITVAKALKVSDDNIQKCIATFPGIPNRLEFVIEKNGVRFYNDSKSETMEEVQQSLASFKQEVILIAGGKDNERTYEQFTGIVDEKVRLMVLVGECKEAMNRDMGDYTQTYLVGSFDESVLIAYQKSRTGDIIVLCPGTSSTDIFRDYVEKGNYYKKLVFQL